MLAGSSSLVGILEFSTTITSVRPSFKALKRNAIRAPEAVLFLPISAVRKPTLYTSLTARLFVAEAILSHPLLAACAKPPVT